LQKIQIFLTTAVRALHNAKAQMGVYVMVPSGTTYYMVSNGRLIEEFKDFGRKKL
jgi:hypothetical protein